MYALIGYGGNGLEIPLVIHNTWQEAFDYLAKYLGIDQKYKLVSYVETPFPNESPYRFEEVFAPNRYCEVEDKVKNLKETGKTLVSVEDKEYVVDEDFEIDFDFDSIPDDNEILIAFFRNGSYYGGCGGCYGIAVRKIQPGQPIVEWDLD